MCCDHCPVVWLFYPSFKCQTDSLSSYLTSSLAYRQIHGWLNDWKVPRSCSHKTNLNPPPVVENDSTYAGEVTSSPPPKKGTVCRQWREKCSPFLPTYPGWLIFLYSCSLFVLLRMGMCSFVWGGTGWALPESSSLFMCIFLIKLSDADSLSIARY